MVVQDVLIKRKTSLDHLRTGLSILNVLETIQKDSMAMRKYFVDSGNLSANDVISKLRFENGSDDEKQSFKDVLTSFPVDMLRKFLVHTTGSPNLWPLRGDNYIEIKFVDASSFGISTCVFTLSVPRGAIENGILKASLESVVNKSYRASFNTV